MSNIEAVRTLAPQDTDVPEWAQGRFAEIAAGLKDVEVLAEFIIAAYQASKVDARDKIMDDILDKLGSKVHADRTASSAKAFSGGRMKDLVVVSARLIDIFDRLFNIDSDKTNEDTMAEAMKLLKKLFKESALNFEEARHISGLGIDGVMLEQKISGYRKDASKDARVITGDKAADKSVQAIISNKYEDKIPEEVWSTIEPFINFSKIFDITKDTNIETIFIKANELLDNLRNPSSERESAVLQDIIEAESAYAVILEVIKFDGLASALRDESHRIRLGMSGKGYLIEESEEHLARIANLGMERIMSIIAGVSVKDRPAVGVDGSLGKVPIFLGEASVMGSENEIYYRLKTPGSRANKIDTNLKSGNATVEPMDDMAMTVVSTDLQSSAVAFADFIEKRILENSETFELKKSPTKSSAIRIQGPGKYVKAVEAELVGRGIDLSLFGTKTDTGDDIAIRGYENLKVSKVTFEATVDGIKVPTEIQFITKEERGRMRRGEIAHIIYKYVKQVAKARGVDRLSPREEREIVVEAVKYLAAIAERFDYLSKDDFGLNERTIGLAEEVLYMFIAKEEYADFPETDNLV